MNRLSTSDSLDNSLHTTTLSTGRAFRYDANITEYGHVDIPVPLRPGVHVTVFVVETPDDLGGI